MSNARILARNLGANWIGHVVNIIVLLFLTPFVQHTLGEDVYGIWSLLTVVTGYMGVLDLGIRASTGRYIILYIGRQEHDKVDQTIRTSLGIFSVIGIFIIAVGVGLGWFFPCFFDDVPTKYHTLIKFLLPLLAANMWISMVRVLFSSVLGAHDRFDLSNGIDLIILAIRTIGTILALLGGYSILGLAVVVVSSNLIGLVGNRYVAHKIYSQLRIWPLMFSRRRIHELYSYGIFAFVSAVSVKIIGQTDLLIAGKAFDVAAAGVYSIGAMLSFYTTSFIGLIGNTFFPPVQRAVARNEMGSARWLLFRQIRLALIFGLPIYAGFCFFAKPFMTLWMFEPTDFPMISVQQSSLVLIILAASNLPALLDIGSRGLLVAMGHVRLTATLSIVEAFLNLSLSLIFVFDGWGLIGIAAGTLVSRIFMRFFVTIWFTCRRTGIKWKTFAWDICGRGTLAFIIFAGLSIWVRRQISSESWFLFFTQIIIVLVCYVPVAFWLLLPVDDQKRIWQKLRSRRSVR